MSPHHPHPPHHFKWLFNSEGYLTPGRVSELYRRLAEDVMADGTVKLKDLKVELPDEVYAILRHERSPSGKLVLRVELQWGDDTAGNGQHPISDFLGGGGQS